MQPEDVGTPLHRDMGVHIIRGVEPWRIFAQYMGARGGPTKGKDGNVHMADDRLGLIAMVSHLPAMLPVAVGCALAFRIRERRSRRARPGSARAPPRAATLTRRMNFAGVRKSPGRLHLRQQPVGLLDADHLEYAIEHLADRAKAYGFEGVVVDGTDVLAVYREARRPRSRRRARAAGRP